MKTIFVAILLVSVLNTGILKAQKLKKVWETTTDLKTPESVLFDEYNDIIYVANINGDPSEKDGNGFISILNSDGSLKTLKWIDNLNAPKGMAIFKGKLYVSDIDQLVEIDINKVKINKKYNAENAVFLNDVAACMNGMIFVTDSRTKKIHVLKDGKLSVYMEGEPFTNPNGLYIKKNKLYVGDANIYEIDIPTKELKMIINDAGGVDGLEKNNEGEFVFSNWPGRIFINRGGKNIKLLDLTEQEINTADIDYDLKRDLVLVPTFFNNKVIAYKIIL